MARFHNIKNLFWNIIGVILVGIAYIGVITPGLPFSPFLVGAAYCFSKGSKRMHNWLYNHTLFGPFLTNWVDKKVFPTKLKYVMIWTMLISLGIMWAAAIPIKGLLWSAGTMILVAIWAWRFPGSIDEYNKRKNSGKRIGWIK
jgi:uncharacterized membrane protein YbaN (DUF454 family)